MTNETSNASSGGIGFMGLLAILFIGLKLTGIIAWSWLWVLCPLWIGLALALLVLAALTLWHVPIIICAAISDWRRARARRS